MFLLFSVTQLPALAVAGIMTWSRLFEGVFALVPVLVLMPFGAWLSGRLSREAFDRLILVLLCIVAVKLLADARSEEHTSELQSLMRISYAVFCLKKKKKQ